MAIELVSYATLKAVLGLSDALITDYDGLSEIRESVTAKFENETGRLFERTERVEGVFFDDVENDMIYLPGIPVASVSSVVDQDANSYTYTITKYGIKLDNPLTEEHLTITYTGGIANESIPDDLSRAAMMQTVYEYQAKDNIGAETVSTTGGSITRPEVGLLKDVRMILKKHRHPLFLT